MKKTGLLLILLFFLSGCDPVYRVGFAVANESGKTIYVVSKQEDDSVQKIFSIHPGDHDTIYVRDGIGYSKPVFEAFKNDVRKGMKFFPDSVFCDTCDFSPAGEWKYSEKNRCNGSAVLVVKNSDLK
ncbi:MAG: hypothetical protein HY064_16485 [Bacteroidetes bacterium]|nr:hypothetical protein [Bacteroidota bacterium]